MNKIVLILIILVFSKNLFCKVKSCDCEIYSATLDALNKEHNSNFKSMSIYFLMDSLYNPLDTNTIKFDTIYYSNHYHQEFKFIVSDFIHQQYNPNFLNDAYNFLAKDSLKEKLKYSYSEAINLYACKFSKNDSITVMNLKNINRDSIYTSFTTKINKYKKYSDTTVYIPNIIYFSKITYLSNGFALLDINTGYFDRKYNRYLLFKRVKNKWILYKLGERLHSL